MKQIKDKFLLVPIILLALYFLIRLLDQSQMISTFPIDQFANDHSSHLARLFFLNKFGFHNLVPNWYGSFNLFTLYHPGYYFFVYPLFLLTNNLQLTLFLSFLIIYFLAFIFLFYLGNLQNLSKIKRIAFYFLFFASPHAVGYFLRLGKYAELLGFTLFIPLAFILLYYKDKKIDPKFLWLIPIYAFLLIAHIGVFIVASIFLLSLFLIKTNKERLYIISVVLTSLALASFWWYPFLINFSSTQLANFSALKWLVSGGFAFDKIISTITPLLFLTTFYFYYKTNNSKKELKFFAIPLILAFLLLTRILVFVPFFNKPISDTYNLFFLFLAIFFFLKSEYPLNLRKFLTIALILLPILGILISILFTPWFIPHTKEVKETFSLLENVDTKLLILKSQAPAATYYAYGAINFNTITPSGWAPEYATFDLVKSLDLIPQYLEEKQCDNLINELKKINTEEVISYKEYCNTLENCNLKQKQIQGDACLFELK